MLTEISFFFLSGDDITIVCNPGYSQDGDSSATPTTSFVESLECNPDHSVTSSCLGESLCFKGLS